MSGNQDQAGARLEGVQPAGEAGGAAVRIHGNGLGGLGIQQTKQKAHDRHGTKTPPRTQVHHAFIVF